MKTGFSVENTTTELAAAKATTAILVFGGAEQCGPCLPCCIDSLLADFLADAYASELEAFRTPTLPFNTSQEHGILAGTLSLPGALMQTITEALVTQLTQQGFRRFILLSPHGGSHWEATAIKEINAHHPEITLISAKDGAPKSIAAAREVSGLADAVGLHGGQVPLCTTAFLRPDLVRPGSYGALHAEQDEQAFNYGLLNALGDDGCWGERIEVRAEDLSEFAKKGRLLWTTFAQTQAQHLAQTLDRVEKLRHKLHTIGTISGKI